MIMAIMHITNNNDDVYALLGRCGLLLAEPPVCVGSGSPAQACFVSFLVRESAARTALETAVITCVVLSINVIILTTS